MKTVFAIRHKPTGFFLPEPKGRSGRGGSHVEPVDCSNGTGVNPRILSSHLSAKRVLVAWLQGKFTRDTVTESDGWEYPAYEVEGPIEIEHVPSRIAEDMEIVEFQLVEISCG